MLESCKIHAICNLDYQIHARTIHNTYNPYSELLRKHGNHAKHAKSTIWTTQDMWEPCKLRAIRNLKSKESTGTMQNSTIRCLNFQRRAGTMQNTCNPHSELPRERGNHANSVKTLNLDSTNRNFQQLFLCQTMHFYRSKALSEGRHLNTPLFKNVVFLHIINPPIGSRQVSGIEHSLTTQREPWAYALTGKR